MSRKNTMFWKKVIIFLIPTICLIVSTVLVFYPNAQNIDTRVLSAQLFLEGLLTSNQEQTDLYISPTLNSYVNENCVDGLVTRCPVINLIANWGDFEQTLYENMYIQANEISIRFLVNWTDQNAWVIILLGRHDNKWLVEGWRGFVTQADDNLLVQLMQGSVRTNEFPPP